jgi:hypothetical protein
MEKSIDAKRLIVPVYINEKIVLDMLAILEDGFSTVSQINYTEHTENNSTQKAGASASTSATILSKLLRINIDAELNHSGGKGEKESVSKEKVHTNVSLLSKFRSYLTENRLLNCDFDVSKMKIGDFIEVEGELQKNPLINYMELFLDLLRMADIFTDKPELGNKTQAKNQKKLDDKTRDQIKSFVGELKHSGTIDFILSDQKGTVVLSVQEQYLSNENVSEIIGGRFKILGKVISVCKDETMEIDLLRKTSLCILSEETLKGIFAGLKKDDMSQFNIPELKTRILGPAVIVIPIAIYA